MKKLSDLQIRDEVYFKDGSIFVIRAKNENYLIATLAVTASKYTIIDTDKEMCGPHDRTFNPYDFTSQEDVEQCLEDMINKNYGIKLSGRHSVRVESVLDLEKTLAV